MELGRIEIVRAGAADRSAVLDLVGRLLAELEERPEEFHGLDRVLTLTEHVAVHAGGRYGGSIDELWAAAWERSVRFYEKLGFVFTGPKLRLDHPGI